MRPFTSLAFWHGFSLLLIFALALGQLPQPCPAQSASDDNEGLNLTADPGAAGVYEFRFWARSGRTYFLQHSTDLTAPWSYFPEVLAGTDAVASYGFTNTAPRVFVRLRYVEGGYAGTYDEDSDGDGFSDQEELELESDPLIADSDGDGLPDAWEIQHFGDLRQGFHDDFDHDGVANGQAYLGSDDPSAGIANRDWLPPTWETSSSLTFTQPSEAELVLNWPTAIDERPGSLRYLLYRNNLPVTAPLAAQTVTVSTLDLEDTHTWRVRPMDVAGNIGPASTAVTLSFAAPRDAHASFLVSRHDTRLDYWGDTNPNDPETPTLHFARRVTVDFLHDQVELQGDGESNTLSESTNATRTKTEIWSPDGEINVHYAGTGTESYCHQELSMGVLFKNCETSTSTWNPDGGYREEVTVTDPEPDFYIRTTFPYTFEPIDYVRYYTVGSENTEGFYTESYDEHEAGHTYSYALWGYNDEDPEDDDQTGWERREATKDITYSEPVTLAVIEAEILRQWTEAPSPWVINSPRSKRDADADGLTLGASRYRPHLATSIEGVRYRMRWLEVFQPEAAPDGTVSPPTVLAEREALLLGTGSAVSGDTDYELAIPVAEGSIRIESLHIALDAPAVIAINEDFDERLPNVDPTWLEDHETPSPLRADGTFANQQLVRLRLATDTSLDYFSAGTDSLRLSITEGAERVRIHAVAPQGTGENGLYLAADWSQIHDDDQLWRTVLNQTDEEGQLLRPDRRLYLEGLAPGKVVLRLDASRYGHAFTLERTLYVARAELAVRDPETGEIATTGGLLDGAPPRPEVRLHVDSAALDASGTKVIVHVSGTISDPLSETLDDPLLRLRALAFEVNGRRVDALDDLPGLAAATGASPHRPWQSVPFSVPFTRTLQIPVRGSGVKIVRALSGPNLAGLRGWDEVAILLGREGSGDTPVHGPHALQVLAIHEGEGPAGGGAAPAVLRIDGLEEAPADLALSIEHNGSAQLLAPLSFSPRYFYVVGPDHLGRPMRYLVTLDDSIDLPSNEALRAIRSGGQHFVLRVGDRVVTEATVQAMPLGGPVETESDLARSRPSKSLDEINQFYKLLYNRATPGDGGVRLGMILDQAFRQSGGILQLTEGDEVEGGPDSTGRLVISVGRSLDPFSAAQGVFEQLVSLSLHPNLQAQILLNGYGGDLFAAGRLSAVRAQSKDLGSAVLNIYKIGVAIVNEGADWAITVDELSEGNYAAAVGFIPFVPAGARFLLRNKGTGAIVAEFQSDTVTVLSGAIRAMKLDKVRGRLQTMRALRDLRNAGLIDQTVLNAMLKGEHLKITKESGRSQLKRVLGDPPSGGDYEAHHWIPLEVEEFALRKWVDPNEHGQWLKKTIHSNIHTVPVPGFTYRGKTFTSDVHNGFWVTFFNVHFVHATEQDILDFAHHLQHTVYKL